jgi:GNAT superfamily N-acetyltransferase
MFTIEPFSYTQTDYEIIAAIYSDVWPRYPKTAAVFRHEDEQRNPDYYWRRCLVKENGRIVGFGIYCEPWWARRPGKFHLDAVVHPAHRGQGAGSAFFDHAVAALQAEQDVSVLMTQTREDKTPAIRFLQRRGFRQVMRYPISRLDLATFDETPFAGLPERAAEMGIEIQPIAALQREDPDWLEKWRDLEVDVARDIPYPDALTVQPLDEFHKMTLHPHFLGEAQFIAVDITQAERPYSGISGLWRNPETPHKYNTGLTGVRRAYRRRGLATALKLHAINYAKAHNGRFIETENEENNPMYQINVRLGFKPQPAWLDFHKEIERS